jgi:fatty acid desaturase
MGNDVKSEDLTSDDPRTAAIARLKAKQHLAYKAGSFAVLTVFFVAIWAISGAGYFWPAWIMVGFAFALAGELWSFYSRKGITEADIEREMSKAR